MRSPQRATGRMMTTQTTTMAEMQLADARRELAALRSNAVTAIVTTMISQGYVAAIDGPQDQVANRLTSLITTVRRALTQPLAADVPAYSSPEEVAATAEAQRKAYENYLKSLAEMYRGFGGSR